MDIKDIKLYKQIMKMHNEAIKDLFKNFIKPNILIRLKEEIKKSEEFSILYHCYSFAPNPLISFGVDDVDFDICSNIAMIYWFYTVNDNNEAKSKKNLDSQFLDKIKKMTILQCRIRKIIISSNIGADRLYISHIPLNYSINATINYIFNSIKCKDFPINIKNKDFKINTLTVMLKTIRSILVLTETNNLGNAFSLFRSLQETACIYFLISDNEDVAKEYYKFMDYRLEYEETEDYPKELLDKIPSKVSKQNYLNYGWIDKLEKLNQKPVKYVFSEIIKNVYTGEETFQNNYLKSYRYCCKYVHGSYVNQSLSYNHYYWILIRVGVILMDIVSDFAKTFNRDFIYNEINLIEYLEKVMSDANVLYNDFASN